MTTKKAIYFLAGESPTPQEQAEIDVLMAASTKPFDLFVRRGDLAAEAYQYGYGPEDCDYVAGSPPDDVPAVPVFASKAGTFSGTGTEDDTITIGDITYTLKDAVTTGANEVKVGATAADTAANLAAAINGGAGAGTVYGSETEPHPDVTASVNAATITVTAKVAGSDGNSIALAETGSGFAWAGGATALSGGGISGFYEEKPELVTSGSGDTVTVTTVDGVLTSVVLS